MCGRYRLTADRIRLERFAPDDGTLAGWEPEEYVSPGRTVPILRIGTGGHREWARALWGLIPGWTPVRPARPPINARIETASVRPSFRNLVERNRALIPADAFYEWSGAGVARRPYRIERADGDLFAFAGLWDVWRPPEGSPLLSVVILTTTPNEGIAPLHDRMPVMLDEAGCDAWLDPGASFEHAARRFRIPFPADRLRIAPVEPRPSPGRRAAQGSPAVQTELELGAD